MCSRLIVTRNISKMMKTLLGKKKGVGSLTQTIKGKYLWQLQRPPVFILIVDPIVNQVLDNF